MIVEDLSEYISLHTLSMSESTILHSSDIFYQIINFEYYGSSLESIPMDFIESNHFHRLQLSCQRINEVNWNEVIDVYDFMVSSCDNITQLNLGKKVKILNASYCRNLTSIEGILPGHYFESVELGSTKLTDYSIFANSNYLNLRECSTLIDISPFANIQYLILSNSSKIEDFSCLGKQKYLDLSWLSQLRNEDLHYLSNVSYLRITNCPSITSLDSLVNNHVIVADNCPGLIDVHLHGHCYQRLSFRHCTHLKDLRFSHPEEIRLISLSIYSTLLKEEDFSSFLDFA
jgi:hypothetical protein